MRIKLQVVGTETVSDYNFVPQSLYILTTEHQRLISIKL